MTTLRFDADTDAIRHLRAADPVLARVLDAVGPYEIELRDDRFTALARAIVGQQLSVSAARTIWGRFEALVGAIGPESVLA
ncbi:MAG: DNA-3-methyladenine glycosylase 2 family protein, partial [Actinobacteria bacterium]